MTSAEVLRGKIHSGVYGTTKSLSNSHASDLTINIPKPAPSPVILTKSKANHIPDGAEKSYATYRDKVLDLLRTEYEGVEKYRLAQDETREKHWKRWGPYLSERQWV